jgi:hypothetical protein
MTDDQVNHAVQHLCEQLHLALRLKTTRHIRQTPRILDLILPL